MRIILSKKEISLIKNDKLQFGDLLTSFSVIAFDIFNKAKKCKEEVKNNENEK